METQYFKEYSPALGRDMEWKVWGHDGLPVLFIPCQNGRFYDFENFRMADVLSHWIDSGQIMVCSVDTVDAQTWSNSPGDPRWRITYHEQWIRYITDEMVPFMREKAQERNSPDTAGGMMVFGCSLGAFHAANLYLRRPDLFDRLLALSGIYTAEYGFGSYMDDLVYLNSPIHYMANMALDHPYVAMLNQHKAVLCSGQGPWELPESTRQLGAILQEKGIDVWTDLWGYDCSHDWDWWHKQVAYYFPYFFPQGSTAI